MKIVEDKLSNGVRVVTAERAESAAVAFHIYFGCGGRHERDEVVAVRKPVHADPGGRRGPAGSGPGVRRRV